MILFSNEVLPICLGALIRISAPGSLTAAKKEDAACDTTLLTLRPQDDPLQILDSLKDTLRGRATKPVEHSTKQEPVYYKIHIKKFLQTAPVEKE
ncbi:COP23 domain-containing protein [Nostoc sp.]|uniref:COP23 domain-containing protein n=1 Tax=Nostoc sp. TaxID=1180 RepID=UPI003FA56DD0